MDIVYLKLDQIDKLKKFCFFALLGAGLMALGGAIKIPCYPVSITLHTLALFVVALTQSPKQATASVLCYLVFYPFGFVTKSGGYCLAFPIAAFLISYLSNHIRPLFAVLAGQGVIFLLGFLWLATFVGAKIAFTQGVLIFIPTAFLKAILATRISGRTE